MKLGKNFIQFLISISLVIPILMIAGCDEPGRDDGVDISFTMMIEKIESRDQEEVTVWDTFIMIDDIDPYDMDYNWSVITISIRIGDYLDIPGASPHKYENAPSRFGTVSVWYDDFSGNPASADPTDIVVITSLTEEYEGALIIINYKGDSSGSIYLPDDFTTS